VSFVRKRFWEYWVSMDKSEAPDIVSPRSLQPSSSSGAQDIPPIVGIPARAYEISDQDYYQRLYHSAREDYGPEAAQALVHLATRMQSDPELRHHSDAWNHLNQACDKHERRQEATEYQRLLQSYQEKKQELQELQAQLKQCKQKRKRTLSLSPRAFANSVIWGVHARNRSRSSDNLSSSNTTTTNRNRLFRSRSSGVLPRLPKPTPVSISKNKKHDSNGCCV